MRRSLAIGQFAIDQSDDAPPVTRETNTTFNSFFSQRGLGVSARRKGLGDDRFERAIVDHDIAVNDGSPMRDRQRRGRRDANNPNLAWFNGKQSSVAEFG